METAVELVVVVVVDEAKDAKDMAMNFMLLVP
jgi:hypothetical protein